MLAEVTVSSALSVLAGSLALAKLAHEWIVVIDSAGQLGTVSSSRRYKEDIQSMAGASRGLMRLRPVTFRNTQAFAGGAKPRQYGLIAEEVAEVYPDVVVGNADGQIETIQYDKINAMLLNEVQEQHRTIQTQSRGIEKLRSESHELLKHLATLDARLRQLEGAGRER